VRAEAPHWLAFLEPMSMSNLGRDSHLTTMPFGDVVYAPHSYSTAAERAGAFADSERPVVLEKLQKLAAEARAMDAALWVGEYGGDGDLGGLSAYMDAEYDAFAAVFSGSAYWDYSRGDGFGILHDDGSEKTVLWDALVRPAPERIAGTPGAWIYDDGTRTLVVSYRSTGDGPSVFRAPARTYPEGFVVDVEGGTAVAKGATVEVDAAVDVDVRVTVRPAD
jgi:endoglycosylceramidase